MNITHMYTHIYFVIIIEYINTFPIYLISASYKISNRHINILNWTLFTASMAWHSIVVTSSLSSWSLA